MKYQDKTNERQNRKLSRRDFISGTATAAAFTIVPRYVLGGSGHTPPSERLNIAGIGLGNQGGADINAVSSENNIVALCDVDDKYAAHVFDRYPKAKKYRDFRRMLEKQKDIDAVIVGTPDHTHAVISMMAMRMGKHVYCEKPLAHTVYEVRKLVEAARKYKVVTQMGNHGHAGEGIRLICEWIWDGAIGDVREVHAWTPLPKGVDWWTYNLDRPKDTPPVPSTLDWDLWVGPAQYRPYHPVYLPLSWRAWWDFGSGELGDMACHLIDVPFWALDLGHPATIEAYSTNTSSEIAPSASIVYYQFPARNQLPPVRLTWYNGGVMPQRPEELEPGRRMGTHYGGVLFVGDKGKILSGSYGKSPRIIPESKMKEYKRPPKSIPRSIGHHKEWVEACKTGKPTGSNFDYAGPLTEIALLGNIAIRTGKKLIWDGPDMKITNVPEANDYLQSEYRKGWSL